MNLADLTITPRELILTLIDSASSSTLSAGYFVAAGELFSIDPRSTRVALGRLVKDGSLTSPGRGAYSLGNRAGTLHTLVRNWAQVEATLKPWSGGWLGVFTAHLTRSDKTSLRGRERALRLFGFAESQPGLWIRPDNLVTPLPELQQSLCELGLEPSATTCVIAEMIPAETRHAQLWDRDQLEAQYQSQLQALQKSIARIKRTHAAKADAGEIETEGTETEGTDAAEIGGTHATELEGTDAVEIGKETLLLGRAVTRQILLDPLLPDEMIDTKLRQRMINTMREYDGLGKSFWRHFHTTHNPL
ncbi:MAG: PaaX [Pseudomonadota bacterium]